MADLGLILGAALAGGVAGAGGAAKDALQSQQKFMQQDDLVHTQNELDTQKQLRIAEVNHGYRMDENTDLYAHQNAMQDKTIAAQATEGDKNRGVTTGEGDKNRANSLAMEQLRLSVEQSMASANRENALAIARMNTNKVETDGTGAMWNTFVGDDGKTHTEPLNGPDGQLHGAKNMDAATTAIIGALKSRADKLAMSDPEAAARAEEQIVQIATAGSAAAVFGADKVKIPKQEALDYLAAHPDTVDQFAKQYPSYWWARTQGGSAPSPSTAKPTGTTSNPYDTGAPGQPPLPASGVGAPGVVNKPPLVNGNIPSNMQGRAAAVMGQASYAPPANVAPIQPAAEPQPATANPRAVVTNAQTFAGSVKPGFNSNRFTPNDPTGLGIVASQLPQ
jgi:hypothetical protein